MNKFRNSIINKTSNTLNVYEVVGENVNEKNTLVEILKVVKIAILIVFKNDGKINKVANSKQINKIDSVLDYLIENLLWFLVEKNSKIHSNIKEKVKKVVSKTLVDIFLKDNRVKGINFLQKMKKILYLEVKVDLNSVKID